MNTYTGRPKTSIKEAPRTTKPRLWTIDGYGSCKTLNGLLWTMKAKNGDNLVRAIMADKRKEPSLRKEEIAFVSFASGGMKVIFPTGVSVIFDGATEVHAA